jgi:hypothetical protein
MIENNWGWGVLTEQSLRKLVQISTERPPRASLGAFRSTMEWLTSAERWIRTVDR